MINRLINMQVPKIEPVYKESTCSGNLYDIADYANSFIDGMNDNQKIRFKQMLENNINCGMSVAQNYGVNYDEFINEVKKKLGVI